MIQSVHFENFRCLKGVELRLEPLTALVGPASSGKTTVLEGFDLLLGCDAADFWHKDERHPAVVEWRYDTGASTRVQYPVASLDSSPMLTHTVQALTLDFVAMREDSSVGRALALNRTGDNLAGVFASLPAPARQRIAQELCRLVPSLGAVEVQPAGSRTQRLRFQDAWKPDLWFAADRVADSALLLLAYLVLPYQVPPPDVLVLDMPERGVAPPLMGEFMKLLRALSTGALGSPPIQVVLATSSAALLRHLEAREIRVLSRSVEEGAVQVSSAPEAVAHWRQRLEQA